MWVLPPDLPGAPSPHQYFSTAVCPFQVFKSTVLQRRFQVSVSVHLFTSPYISAAPGILGYGKRERPKRTPPPEILGSSNPSAYIQTPNGSIPPGSPASLSPSPVLEYVITFTFTFIQTPLLLGLKHE